MSPPLVEFMIPTLNEASHIEEVVANARLLGPVYVLDSLSTDGTQELARQAGAMVIEHAFENYSAQKNWGIDNLPFQGAWIFILDADERITPQLREEILRRLGAAPTADGFYVNRSLVFMGRSVRYGGLYPSWNLRLFRRGKARYEARSVHEHMICDGATDYLREELIHIRRETIAQYIAKHIRYAEMESEEWFRMRSGAYPVSERSLFKDILLYRQWLRRHLWPRMLFRPLLRFIYMYIFRLGFLDGRAGWHAARLMACYEYMISLLYREKIMKARETRVP